VSVSKEMLEEQLKGLIRKLSEKNVELETMRMERDLWKGKFQELSSSKTISRESLKSDIPAPKSRRTSLPNNLEEEISLGEAALYIAKHPELKWKKGKEKARHTI